MNRSIYNLITITLCSSLLISCGGSSSYPTTETEAEVESDPTVTTTLDLSAYDSCEYYGLQDSTTSGSCFQHGTAGASDVTIANLRNSSGATRSVDESLSSSGVAGFVGANNIMQIAEAQAILSDLGRSYDGTGSTVAILGSGFNNVGTLSTGTSNNYGYLNDAKNIEDKAAYTSAYEMINDGDIDGYSIFNKNTSESFAYKQRYALTSGGLNYTTDQIVQKHSKFILSGGTAVSYVYDIALADSGVSTATDGHITSLASYHNGNQGSFGSDTFAYDSLVADGTTVFCTDSDTCSRNYHTFLSEDYVGTSYEYQSSIFEYGHGDVANGTALASIIGMSGNTNITGSATGATLSSYKTQMYHRKLLDINSNYLQRNDGHNMNSVLEDNTGLILYNALNDAQSNNQIVLLNNQFRNYESQFYLNDTVTNFTDFYAGYTTTTDPTQLDQFEEFEIYRFNTGVAYNYETTSSVYNDYITGGGFIGGNFMSYDSLAVDDSGPLNYSSASYLAEDEVWVRNNTGESYGNSGTYKYLTDADVASEYSSTITSIKNLLKSDGDGSDNIYVIPTDNKFFIDLVNGLNDSEDNTIIAVTDVAVNSVTYSSTELDYDFDSNSVLDYDGIYQIASMSLNTSFTGNVNGDPGLISVNDCSSVTSGAVCFIAPGNTASLDSNGAYTNFDDLDESGYTNLNGTNYGLDSGGSKDGIDQGEYLGSAYVTSAIAIIAGAWSAEITAGSITMTEIVSKLKDTAITADSITGCNSEDGTTTTDAVDCGDGMINLLAAMDASFIVSSEGGISQPVMQTTASASNFAYSLANTSLTSALYFGDALTINATSILSKAVYNDSYNFSYDANLESKISSESDLASSRYAVLDYFDFDNDVITESEIIPVGANFSFAMTSTKSKYDDNEFSKRRIFESPDNAESDVELSNINFSQDLNSKVSVKMGFNSYDAGFDVIPEQYAVSGSISFASGNEYASLLGSDTGFSSLKFNVSKNLDSYIGFATSEENDSQYLFSKFNYDLGRSFVSFSLGTLIENDNFLGSKTSGAFGLDEGTQTTYYGLGFVKNIGSDIDFISKIDVGITTIDSNEYSVFKDFRDVRSQETSFALVKRLKGATFGVSYTEPMRVSSGDSLISVSTGQSLDGDVDLASEWVSLESSGKERNYEMFYTSELDNEDSITLNYVYITEANHIAANSDEQLFVLKYSKEF